MAHDDAFGQLLLDHLEGRPALELVERDDGFLAAGRLDYFVGVRHWPACERRALRLVRGRVLDVGCGAGRAALELQRRGREVVGIDSSPGAVEACRRRGVRDVRLLRAEEIGPELGRFRTILMWGNNFGLVGGERSAARLLRRLARVAEPGARLLAESTDPYATEDPAHLAYHERNRVRGRMPGLLRLRVRHRHLVGPWLDYLFASPDEMRALAEGTGWRLARTLPEPVRPLYVGVLERERAK